MHPQPATGARRPLARALGRLGGGLLDLLFPPRCVGCRREGSYLCPPCLAGAARTPQPACLLCARPLTSEGLCQACQAAASPLDGIRSPFLMEGAIREAVHRLKYSNLRAIAPALAGLLAEHLQAHPVPADLIVPVPLHPRRERQRGFNQAALLAKEAGRRLRLPLVERALARVRDSPPQARSASREERRANVQGAFMARQGFQGRCVLLVDDVCTTGATLEACAGALRNAGASSIWALTLAREP